MTLKGQKTAAEYIQWDRFKTYLRKTEIDGEHKICLVSIFGAFFLMRIGDILELRWSNVLDGGHKGKNTLTITENKNRQRLSKKREIGVNGSVKEVIERVYQAMGSPTLSAPIFLREDKSGVISRQYVNQKLKSVNTKYRLGLAGQDLLPQLPEDLCKGILGKLREIRGIAEVPEERTRAQVHRGHGDIHWDTQGRDRAGVQQPQAVILYGT